MPLYEYHCQSCKRDVELLLQKHDDSPICPECGSRKMTKLLSAIGAPVLGNGASQRTDSDAGTCGRPQCARGCMFGD
jgi:putative FmdB family regulatory protein